jgi:hypothetical protein
MAALTLQAKAYIRRRGHLFATVVVLLDGTPIHADTLALDASEQRDQFVAAVRDRLNSHHALADDLDARLLELMLATDAVEERAEAADALDARDRGSQADKLVHFATATELFHDRHGDCYARLQVGSHFECWPTRSKGFKRYLGGRSGRSMRRRPAPRRSPTR